MTGRSAVRYTLGELRFIAARVLAEVRATPPQGPLLGETPPAETCQRGHTAMVVRSDGHRRCADCARERSREQKRRRRAEGVRW